jgi:hypothetical protein
MTPPKPPQEVAPTAILPPAPVIATPQPLTGTFHERAAQARAQRRTEKVLAHETRVAAKQKVRADKHVAQEAKRAARQVEVTARAAARGQTGRATLRTLSKRHQRPVADVLEQDLRDGRIEELVREALIAHDHLVQLHYLDNDTGDLMEVVNTFEEKSTGVMMATAMCVGEHHQVYDLKDAQLRRGPIAGSTGIAALITSYGQTRAGQMVDWPTTDAQWLQAQESDVYLAAVASRLADPTMMIPLEAAPDVVCYLYRDRPLLPRLLFIDRLVPLPLGHGKQRLLAHGVTCGREWKGRQGAKEQRGGKGAKLLKKSPISAIILAARDAKITSRRARGAAVEEKRATRVRCAN